MSVADISIDSDATLVAQSSGGESSAQSPLPGTVCPCPWLSSQRSVVAVSLGYAHAAMLLAIGDVYTWGSSRSGALGHGEVEEELVRPMRVETLGHGTVAGAVIQVACGSRHCLALGADRVVRSWGADDFNQLGIETLFGWDGDVQPRPRPVTCKSMHGTTTLIASGWCHNAAIAGGALFTWGWGRDGQLGHAGAAAGQAWASIKKVPLPLSADAPASGSGDAVAHVSCGYSHTVLCTQSGALCVAGRDWIHPDDKTGLYTRASPGSHSHHHAYGGISLVVSMSSRGVRRTACGKYHTVAICVDGTAWAAGQNPSAQLGAHDTVELPLGDGHWRRLRGWNGTETGAPVRDAVCTAAGTVLALAPWREPTISSSAEDKATHSPLDHDSGSTENSDNDRANMTCAICLEIVSPSSNGNAYLTCGHGNAVHARCIENWLRASDTCPLCKRTAAAAQLRPCKGWLVPLGSGIGVGVDGNPDGCRSVEQAAAQMVPGARCAAANDVVFATVT